jgi:F-type H+-transporting ATPase subunit epsilon
MSTLHFDFVSPEKVLFSGEVDQVDLPGAEGDMGILANHAPLVTTLRPGVLTTYREAECLTFAVTGGFAEVSAAGLTVLAEVAALREDFDITLLAGEIEEYAVDTEDDAERDKLARRLAHLKELQRELAQ